MKTGDGVMRKKDNRGSTMVSVVVSFALLMILIAAFYRVQKVSENMMMSAKDLIVNNRNLAREFYLGETNNHPVASNICLTFSGSKGNFYVDASLYQAQKQGLSGTIYFYGSEEGKEELVAE